MSTDHLLCVAWFIVAAIGVVNFIRDRRRHRADMKRIDAMFSDAYGTTPPTAGEKE